VGGSAELAGGKRERRTGNPCGDARYKTRTCDLHDVNVAL
jgi:hypothetical protein